ncbi:MAG: prepilin-type N-terminal cleavage/methylation domain-containing protein [Candidatus Aminicenantes bacterium]|nr:prepilin-type N-terminal cleavage/methylation domain-containing protein [Candidatus Aminicenantes bacterium]
MRKNKSGFSLIELLLVLILIGTIVAMTASFTTRNKDRWSLRDLAREITSTYYQARQRAARENASMRIEILQKSYTYYRDNIGIWETLRKEDFPEKIAATVTANFLINPSGFILDPASLKIAGLQTITLSAPRGAYFDTMTITIYPYGGLRVEKDYK